MAKPYSIEPGSTYGRWTVHEPDVSTSKRKHETYYFCRCECGNSNSVTLYKLSAGLSKSCGCLAAEKSSNRAKTHGMTNSREYTTWDSMMMRCNNPNHHNYPRYGGRGIKVESPLNTFDGFYAATGPRPEDKTLDRIDRDGNYAIGNIRWANTKQQTRNRSTNRILTFQGKSQTIQDWSEESGISRSALDNRIARNWDIAKALTQPVQKKRSPR